MNDTQKPAFKSGFITIFGAPNAGKSTLLNFILGEKVSIVSSKPQTTRNRILGVAHYPNAQMVFFDTPGVFETSETFNARIVSAAMSALSDSDIVIVMVDVSVHSQKDTDFLTKTLQKAQPKALLALNKIDKVDKQELLALMDKWSKLYDFKAIVPVSALNGAGVDILLNEAEKLLPEGMPFYPADTFTEMSERFITGELIREKVFRFTGAEIPYATAIHIDEFKEKQNVIYIAATINVERNSQKGIIIGKGGAKLKEISTEARRDIERMVGCKVFLELFVRVHKNWRRDLAALNDFGY